MRLAILLLIMGGIMLAANPTFASDKSYCLKGIARLKAIKLPTPAQKKKLSDAEQEQMERDWSECREVLEK
jgi:hypothetical protein